MNTLTIKSAAPPASSASAASVASSESASDSATPGTATEQDFRALLKQQMLHPPAADPPETPAAVAPTAISAGDKDGKTDPASAATTPDPGAQNALIGALPLLALLPAQPSQINAVPHANSGPIDVGDNALPPTPALPTGVPAAAPLPHAEATAASAIKGFTLNGETPSSAADPVKDFTTTMPTHAAAADAPASNAAMLPTALPAVPTASEMPQRVEAPLGDPGWPTEVAQHIVWLVDAKQQTAELHINPPHLGPIEIKLTLHNDQASATFTSPHSLVRETLESALPRLREVLAESGISLGQASVTADSPRDGSAFAQPYSSGPTTADATSRSIDASARAIPAVRTRLGLVDLFA